MTVTPGQNRTTRSRVVLVGGGLANGLIAYQLQWRRPEIEIIVIEQGERLGGEHTWSFHGSDVTPGTLAWLEPFISYRWPGQSIRFRERERRFATPYFSVTSARFHAVLSESLGRNVILGARAKRITPNRVELEDGTFIEGDAVIDGRGPTRRRGLILGWQKFFGLVLKTAQPHGLELPVIMDATVPQVDGFRFVYVLPFAADRMLVEDTHYSDTPGFDAIAYEREVMGYAARRGWTVEKVLASERGALPIALGGDIDALFEDMPGVPRVGLGAGLFHPTTGYSLPDAARLAELIADEPTLKSSRLFELTRSHARKLWQRRSFHRALNRMLFRAAEPERRHAVLSHFYRLPEGLIERFYADRLTLFDKARILSGRPPVPIPRAIRALRGSGVLSAAHERAS